MFLARSPIRSISVATRDRQHGAFLDITLHLVDFGIGPDDTQAELDVAPHQRVDRIGDLAFRKPAHLGDKPG